MDKYRTEALNTLRHENATFEAFYTFEIEGKKYAIGIMLTNGAFIKMDVRPLNQEHARILKECLEPIGIPEEIYKLSLE